MELKCDCGCGEVIQPKEEVITLSFDTRTADDRYAFRLWSGGQKHYIVRHVHDWIVDDLQQEAQYVQKLPNIKQAESKSTKTDI